MKQGRGKLVYVCYKHELEELYVNMSLERLIGVEENRKMIGTEKESVVLLESQKKTNE